MDAKEKSGTLIQTLGRKMGLENLAFGEDGMVVFEVDGSMTLAIGLEADTQAITLYAPLHGSGGQRDSDLLEQLLAANLLWQETQGATLALDRSSNHVVLHQRLPLSEMSQEAFEQHVDTFTNTLQAMTRRIIAPLPSDETTAFAAPPPGALRV